MPRPPRIEYVDALHHVTLKAQRSEPRFRCTQCRSAVFMVLEDAASRFKTELLAYGVMSTHLHLYFRSPDAELPRTMQYVSSAITRCINTHHGEDGHVFKGRYFNRVVESESYRAYLLAYIHLNPTKAGLSQRERDPAWTSHAFYAGERDAPDWLHTNHLLEAFGGPDTYASYLEAARTGLIAPPSGFEESVLLHPRCTDRYTHPERELPVKPDPVDLLQRYELRHGRVLRGRRRGRHLPERDQAMAWMLREGATQVQIAQIFGLSQPAVSRAIQRAPRR